MFEKSVVFSLSHILLFGNTSRQIMHNPFKRTSVYKDHGSPRLFGFFSISLYYKHSAKGRKGSKKTPQSEHWQVCVILEGEKAGLWLCFYLERLLLLMTCASPVEVNGALMSLPFPFVPG